MKLLNATTTTKNRQQNASSRGFRPQFFDCISNIDWRKKPHTHTKPHLTCNKYINKNIGQQKPHHVLIGQHTVHFNFNSVRQVGNMYAKAV